MSIDTFSSILGEFANRIGLGGLQIDPSGYCCLDVDQGTIVHLKHEDKRDSMIVISEIGQLPDMNTSSVLRYLLRMNDSPEESKGMTISYNSESNNAAIGYQYPLRFLDITKFEEFFKMFLDEVERWKKKMSAFMQGTVPDGEGSAGASKEDASKSTAGAAPQFMIGA